MDLLTVAGTCKNAAKIRQSYFVLDFGGAILAIRRDPSRKSSAGTKRIAVKLYFIHQPPRWHVAYRGLGCRHLS